MFELSYVTLVFTGSVIIVFAIVFAISGILIRYGKKVQDREWRNASANGKIILRDNKTIGYKISLVYSSNVPMDIPHS